MALPRRATSFADTQRYVILWRRIQSRSAPEESIIGQLPILIFCSDQFGARVVKSAGGNLHGTSCCRCLPGEVGDVCIKDHRSCHLTARNDCWTAYCRAGRREVPRSRTEFVHKLRIAVKEVNETGIRLLIMLKARMAREHRLPASSRRISSFRVCSAPRSGPHSPMAHNEQMRNDQ